MNKEVLDIIANALPDDAKKAHLAERITSLAVSGFTLSVDRGVANLSEEDKKQIEEQLTTIAAEISRLQSLIDE